MKFEQQSGISGQYRTRVMGRDGRPVTPWSKPSKNLILPAGVADSSNWQALCSQCHAGTGSTPNKVTLDGTFSQAGTTVTRTTGTGIFISANVNDFIKFATGETARIVSLTNSVTVEVDRSQTVAAAALTVYDTSRVNLDTWVKHTSTTDAGAGLSGYTGDADAGTARYWKTFNFSFETSAKSYTEIGVSRTGNNSSAQLMSRIVLDSAVNVDVDQFLQVRFDLICTMGNCRVSTPVTPAITGWPYTYLVQSIVANGSYWDVTLDKAHHFAAGRPITIAGALPVRSTITTLASTGSDFTVTTGAAHNKNPGDSIVIAGATPSAYNGTWTVATTPTSTTLTVTSAINPGAGSGGTLRLSTPGTWFDGTHTIASIPSGSVVRITNAATPPNAGVDGTVKNNLNCSAICTGWGFFPNNNNSLKSGGFELSNGTGGNNGASLYAIPEASLKTGLQYGVTSNTTGSVGSVNATSGATYDAANRRKTWSFTYASSVAVSQLIRQLGIQRQNSIIFLTFEERQRKDDGFQLVVSFTLSWEPALD